MGYARRNFLVPVPHVASWEELNRHLLEQCQQRRERKLWGHTETIAERFERDREQLLPLPPAPYEACEKRTTRVSSLSLVRYRTNDYSVPVAYGHRQVLLKAFVWKVVISCGSEIIARHSRSYEREEMIFDPLHYPATARKEDQCAGPGGSAGGLGVTGRVPSATPVAGSPVGEARAPRTMCRFCGLLETFSLEDVQKGVEAALRFRAISFDAVKHLVLCAIEQRPPRLDLENYPHLPVAEVAVTKATDYQALLSGVAR